MFDLSNLKPAAGATHRRKRKGRGTSAGQGKTCGRGTKGQRARTSGNVSAGFEGGQMPLYRRLPKRGFHNPFKKRVAIVNVGELSRFDAGAVVDELALREHGLISGSFDAIKVLGEGSLEHALTVRVHAVSASAREKIESVGGSVEVQGG
jgi:large subunit ribosomal protein L15